MGAVATATLEPMVKVCRFCGGTDIRASLLRTRRYICDECLPAVNAQTNRTHAARRVRYDHSEKGRTRRRLRLWVGQACVGRADTVERAAQINAHIRRRRREFITRFASRAEAESGAADHVSSQAEP